MAIRVKRRSNLGIPTENYIILHHINKVFLIPVDPDAITDSMSVSFAENMPLSRSAPIYSYQNSGPRSVQFQFTLHRDLVRELNPEMQIEGEDPVDALITWLDAIVLPDYDSANKIVNPPLVSVKIRDEIYIKGVVTGNVGVTYGLPLINYGTADKALYKYAMVTISFGVNEITPYSASILPKVGGKFRQSSGMSDTSGASSSSSNIGGNAGTSSAVTTSAGISRDSGLR